VEASPLQDAIGERLRQLREARGLRQEDIAAGARRIGLRWNRPTIALVENGIRQLSVGEFLAMAVIYMLIMNEKELGSPSLKPEKWLKPVDFLPTKGWFEIGKGCALPAAMLREVVDGNLYPSLLPTSFFVHRRADEDIFETEALGDAEEKAARRLKVSAVEVAKAARQLWQRSLTEERDRRVREQASDESSRRRLQALRGHVSRTLTAEISTILPTTGSGKSGLPPSIDDAASRRRRSRRRRKQSSNPEA
jgi:transcriptional regulator with XRE-family HTH domain